MKTMCQSVRCPRGFASLHTVPAPGLGGRASVCAPVLVRMIAGMVVGMVVGGTASMTLAQSCHLESHMQASAVANGPGTNSDYRQDTGAVPLGPAIVQGTGSDSGPGGAHATSTGQFSSDYGLLTFSGGGSASNSTLSGADSSLGSYIGGAPNAMFYEPFTVTSATLPPGTPASVRIDLDYSGSASAGGVGSTASVSCVASVQGISGSPSISAAAATHESMTVTVLVGPSGAILVTSLYAACFANANQLTPPITGSFSIGGSCAVHMTCLTAGAGIVSCSGHDYTPPPACGSADFNCDGDLGTDSDIEAFFACLAGTCPPPPCASSADFNGDGDLGTDADIESFFRVLAGGPC